MNSFPNRALLILDNAPCHPAATSLCRGNIKAVFLPPNVTALLQPMDQGVLQNVKCSYRKMLLRKLIESDGSFDSVLQLIKNVTIKDVIYWVSESWDSVTQNCLVKSRKKLWPSLADSNKVKQGEANKSEILPLIKCIPGCEDATEHTVTEWLSCDSEANQLYTDEEIISLVQNKPQDDSDLEESDEPENVLVSHSEAANALEIALRYIEQNKNATSTDNMFMRRWHNIA
ncbi:Tigger transposable element-derived protein 2 [Araneus ventricosus]|uniref:Tigger transposable element-derived protein 2 n=1 Tax=Araneus ventricosus TaxID=182803 RepID=A0A4Y2AIU6_ARAVE|nr:Tigger transposable element-derived protein 2 [Araneus ventricosus]